MNHYTPPTSDEIRAFRKQTGLTQEQLARELGTSMMTIRRWEQNHHAPTGVYLKVLRDYMAQWNATQLDAANVA